MQPLRSTLVACVAALLAAPCARAELTLGAGVEYTAGKFGGTETTHTLYVPFSARYDTGPWSLKATLPYIVVSGPAATLGTGPERVTFDSSGSGGSGSGSGGGGSDDFQPGERSNGGMGDILLSAFRILLDERSAAFGLDVGAKMKLGTADREARLGTGENDYSLQADLFKPFGALTPFASFGFRWYGDPPGIELRDVPYWALGASYRASASNTLGASYDYRRPIVAGGAPLREISAFVSSKLSEGWRLQLYGLVGLSDGSPDAGVGMLLNYRFQ